MIRTALLIGGLGCLIANIVAGGGVISAAELRLEAKEEKKEAGDAKESDDDKTKVKSDEDDKKKKKSVAEVTKDCDTFPGLLKVFRDKEKGTVFFYIAKEQLGKEFIYFTHGVDGVVAAGTFRGQFGDQSIVKLTRHFGKVEFVRQNTAFYFDPLHPLARAAAANTSHALLAAQEIVAEDDKGVLIEADDVFLKETLLQVKPSVKDEKKSLLGKLSETKTKFTTIKNYPQNTALEVEYVYDNPTPPVQDEGSSSGEEEVDGDFVDRRAISVTIQHTFIELPKNDYQPRFDDARVGYFMTQITDQTSTEATPWRDVIHRWDLRKKDPAAPLSEPREPIVWWLENTTPLEFRDTIRSAALQWNKSFEKVGLKDVIVVKQQPDDADWDAGDVRYNVLRWTSSPNPPFGGYGPSFVNPRSGQILGADIMLEFVFVKNRIFAKRLWETSAMSNKVPHAPGQCCEAGMHLHHGVMLGQQLLRLREADEVEMDRLVKEALTHLVVHEIGHTLGLNHNFKASHLHTTAEMFDQELTERTGLASSVMDYMPLNLPLEKGKQVQYFTTMPGAYDDWAIAYGYTQALTNEKEEKARLAALAGRSHEPALAFGNDADDMRAPGKAIDPRAMIGDMSSDPIAYGVQRIELVRRVTDKLLERYENEGPSWQELTNAYMSLTFAQEGALTAISRYIGGVYVDRAIPGQVKEGGASAVPLRPVETEKQKAAMAALSKYAFAPDAWLLPPALLSHLQQQRRGFEFFNGSENPKPHERVLNIQKALLEHLLHHNTQNRIIESGLMGDGYPLAEVMSGLSTAIMLGEGKGVAVSTLRQNLQLDYVDRLIVLLKSAKHQPAARSVALYELQGIRKRLGEAKQLNKLVEADRPHVEHVLFKIEQALEVRK